MTLTENMCRWATATRDPGGQGGEVEVQPLGEDVWHTP